MNSSDDLIVAFILRWGRFEPNVSDIFGLPYHFSGVSYL